MNGGKPHGGRAYDSGYSAFQKKGLISPMQKVDPTNTSSTEEDDPKTKLTVTPKTDYEKAAETAGKPKGITFGGITEYSTANPKGEGGTIDKQWYTTSGQKATQAQFLKAKALAGQEESKKVL